MFCNKFHAVTERSKIHPNTTKRTEHIGIGSNVVDWLCSLQKILTRLRGMNFCNNCTSSTHFAPSFMQLRNDPKCIQTLWNTPKHEFWVQWGWIKRVRCEKLQRDFVARTFVLIAPVQYVLHQVSCSYKRSQMQQNTVKQTETLIWGPTGWIGCVRCEKYDVTSRHQLLH